MPAPGTWGSAIGLIYFVLGFRSMSVIENLIVSALGAYLAIALCGEAELRLQKRDPGEVILDEVVAMPLCFLGWGYLVGPFPAWSVLLAGFVLFRVFDIFKPWVINSLQELPGGWGVVLDDTAAALAACATLHIAHAVWMLF
jgi:phosphatidylglycerophosphatase A